MFTISFAKGGEILKKIVETLKEKDHVPEASIVVSEEGIFLQSMDTAHVAVVDLLIRPAATQSYECEGSHSLGISFEALSKILKCSFATGTCQLNFTEEKPDVLEIKFLGSKKASFELKLMDIESERMELPDEPSHTCQMYLDSAELQKVYKDMSTFSDDVLIKIFKNELSFCANGESANGNVSFDVECETEPVESLFNLKYLQWFARGSTLCDEVLLAVDNENPLLMQFEDDFIKLRFYLAPKSMDTE